MNRIYSVIRIAAAAALIVCGCNKPLNRPEDQSVRFQFDIQYDAKPHTHFLFRKNNTSATAPSAKTLNLQSIDMVRVMVVDFSVYDSFNDVLQSSWWLDYSRAAQSWTGNRESWAEWKKFVGDYMSIVCDQTLEIRGQEAIGTVPGVIGLNRIVVCLLENNVIKYEGEGDGFGVEGETRQVQIEVQPWDIQGDGGGDVTVTSITIIPDSTLLFSSQNQFFSCAVRYSDWSTDTLASEITWSISPGTFGTMSSSGWFQAGSLSDGNETVTATLEGMQDQAKVKVIKGTPGEMILIPAGSFTMGKNVTSGWSDYNPAHTVTLNAYHIDRFEVTCSQYALYLNSVMSGGSVQISGGNVVKSGHILTKAIGNTQLDLINNQFYPKTGMGNYPIIGLSWWGAEAYASYYNKRLPTEAEWEKAARGTDGREYPWGNAAATGYYYNYSLTLKPIGQFHPQGDSPYGLSDMAGNANEWVNDWYSDTYYASSPASNPTGPTTGTEKVLRGGSIFYNNSYFVNCYSRGRMMQDDYTRLDYGFRCADNP